MSQHAYKSTDAIKAKPKHLSGVNYMHNLQKAGVSPDVAKIQGDVLENIAEQIAGQYQHFVENFATKDELKAEIKVVREEIKEVKKEVKEDIKELSSKIESNARWMFSIMIAFGCGMLGVMAKGFHWI